MLTRPPPPPSPFRCNSLMIAAADQDRISDFELKLMDIDSEHLGIPKTEYNCIIQVNKRSRGMGGRRWFCVFEMTRLLLLRTALKEAIARHPLFENEQLGIRAWSFLLW